MWFKTRHGRRNDGRRSIKPLVEALETRSLLSVSGAITGFALEDVTGNGATAGDPPIAAQTVKLFADNGDGEFNATTDALIGTQQTNPNGRYNFNQLSAGTYFVQPVLPLNWGQTGDAAHVHDEIVLPGALGPKPAERNDTLANAIPTGLTSGGTYRAAGVIGDNTRVADTLDVDLYRLQANAGDVIRVDVDGNAFQSPLDGVARVFDANGVQVAGNDDAEGNDSDPRIEYIVKQTGTYFVGVSGFANVEYNPRVEESGNPNFAFNSGPYTVEINVGPRAAAPTTVVLADGEHRDDVNLSAARLGAIKGQMFEDVDGDGVQDPGEPGLDNWLVVLGHGGVNFSFIQTRSIDLNHDGHIDPATESGWYEFGDLTPGIYFTRGLASFGFAPAGWQQVSPTFEPDIEPDVGSVSSGPATDPGVPGLLPDLTVDLQKGLFDWFLVGNTLHYAQATPNIGAGPMELRAGPDLGNGTQIVYQRIYQDAAETSYIDREAGTFIFHPEHNHIHFNNYATFTMRQTLADINNDGLPEIGAAVTSGQKTSFCLVDVAPYDLTLPNADPDGSGLGCGEVQRISVGWEDIYDAYTSGQQMDVSGLPNGQYWLEVMVDPLNELVESNEANNLARVLVTIDRSDPRSPVGLNAVEMASGQSFADQDFGNFRLITISGQVFQDFNANGVQDPKDNGLAGRIVFLDLNGDGILNNPEGNGIASALALEPWSITDKHGQYVFTGVVGGTYLVREVVPAGWTQTTISPAPIVARSGQSVAGVNFGVVSISGSAASNSGGLDVPLEFKPMTHYWRHWHNRWFMF